MAITNTIASIKEYFDSWHNSDSHAKLKTNTISNDTTHVPTSKAVYDAIQGVNNNISQNMLASNITMNSGNTVQSTLDNYITPTLNQKADKETYATAEHNDWYLDPDRRGVYVDVTGETKNGLMTWKDKAYLMELGTWHEITGTGLTSSMNVWANFALRLVYFYFGEDNSKKLKYSTQYVWDGKDSVLFNFRPVRNIFAPTSVQGTYMGVTTTCKFWLQSEEKIKSGSYSGSLMWFYRDGDGTNYEYNHAGSDVTSTSANGFYNKISLGD